MRNIREVSKHYLKLVAEADRSMNSMHLFETQGSRNIYFWDALQIARKVGIDDFELDQVVQFLGKNGLLYWRHNFGSTKTVELTDKGFKWEFHESLFDEPIPSGDIVNNISIGNISNSIVNIMSQLDHASQSIQSASALPQPKRDELAKLFAELKDALSETPDSHSGDAEVVAEQVEVLSEELKKSTPRPAKLKVTAAGLIEAAKALGAVVPSAINIAKDIASFVANPLG